MNIIIGVEIGGLPYMSKRRAARLKVIPLGGVEEIGKNMTVLEYGNDIIVVDVGLAFPTEEMLGVDLVIPDVTYLAKNRQKIRGIILTHGHEDHIGALPYVLKELDAPVYGTKLTIMLAQYKLAENGITDAVMRQVEPREKINLGCFVIEFIKTSHSILDSVGLSVNCPVGRVVMTGDFKIDYTPVDGSVMDLARFAQLGEEGVLLLMAESTNVERPGYTISEKIVGVNLDNFFREAKGRIIISTFSSNIHRIQQIIDSALRYGRKICFAGRSMIKIAKMAQELGYLKVREDMLVPLDKVKNLQDKRLVVITTGSQGEPMSGLVRMAGGEHSQIEIHAGDTVIISARPIPGNEKYINRVIDQLFRMGANVIYDALAEVHASGHACQEELKLIHTLVKPRYFMPIHGEYRHLKQHALLAESLGMSPKNIFIPQNGHAVEFSNAKGAAAGETVQAGGVLVDGLGIGDVSNVVLRDRKHLSQDGLVAVVMTISREAGTMLAPPEIISRGFVYVKENEGIMDDVKKLIVGRMERARSEKTPDWAVVKSDLRNELRKFLYERTKRNPMILPIVVEI
jgi:ribonuclease J